jgi:hypothetical protein
MDEVKPDPVAVSESTRKPPAGPAGPLKRADFAVFYRFFGLDIDESSKLTRADGHHYVIHKKPFQNRKVLDAICPAGLLPFGAIDKKEDAEEYLRAESCDLVTVGSPTSNAFSRVLFGYQKYDEGTDEHDLYGYLRKCKTVYPESLKWGIDKADIELLAETPFQAEFERGSDVESRHLRGKNWYLKVNPDHLLIDKPFRTGDDVLLVPEADPAQRGGFLTDYLTIVSMPNLFSGKGRLIVFAGTHRLGTAATGFFFQKFEAYQESLKKQRQRLLGKNGLAEKIAEEVVFRVIGGNNPALDLIYYNVSEI